MASCSQKRLRFTLHGALEHFEEKKISAALIDEKMVSLTFSVDYFAKIQSLKCLRSRQNTSLLCLTEA